MNMNKGRHHKIQKTEANETNDIMNEDDNAIMKSIPFGIEDFKELRENDGYFVDKTVLIEDIITDKTTKVFLFTRPRRFGKSLNMSMLDAFFNMKYKGNAWFEGLKVSDSERCNSEKNRYPVILISLKGLESDDYGAFIDEFRARIVDVFARYDYLLDSDLNRNLLEVFRRNSEGKSSETDLKNSLMNLTRLLEAYHHEKVIVLIDEYDNPIQHSYGKESQEKIIGFMRGLMTNVLKTNESLKFGVVTGVMQIAKESIFSGLNNLYVNNILSENFEECYGFTESEVKELLAYYGHPEKFDECKEWYDGYTFGNAEVYNPWSVINYVKEKCKPAAYWGGTSGNDIIKTLMKTTDDDVWNDLERLSKGEVVNKRLNPQVVYQGLEGKTGSIYSVMAMSGYLKAKKAKFGYDLSIPNKEMYQVYSDMIMDYGDDKRMAETVSDLFEAMKRNDTDSMERMIHELMEVTISAKVLDSEHSYQAYLIGMMMGFCGNYEIYGDTLESGDGFADIIFKKMRGPGCNLVLELKKSDDEKDLEKDAERAMQQILDRDYAHGLEGKTLLYGISFHSKKPYIVSKTLD